MNILRVDQSALDDVAPLVADFRVALRSYKGIESDPDVLSGKEELLDFLQAGYPIFAAEEEGKYVGYVVCRIANDVLWVEHIYVREACRRKGVASLLFAKAEETARALGGDTVFNFVHPNNEGMISFLRSKGYTVLNLIEIRKPYQGEQLQTTVQVNHNTFDY